MGYFIDVDTALIVKALFIIWQAYLLMQSNKNPYGL